MDFEQAPINSGGRPSTYSDEMADAIVEMLYAGHGLRAIAATPGMPSAITITRWKASNEQFRSLYEAARQFQLEMMAEDILTIADNARDFVAEARLRVEARKWLLSKLVRHVYGDAPAPEVKPAAEYDYSDFTDEEVIERIRLEEKALKKKRA